mmetsp:Transcript_34154/g.74859  ORF Transcript_34154/g.74859 Transcript_34154/m.74859 type:complete len:238 (+) Transcript_34154:207-920(+)
MFCKSFSFLLVVLATTTAPSALVAADQRQHQVTRELQDCPVKVLVKCTSLDGEKECNSIRKLDDDCETNVLYSYSLEVTDTVDGNELKFISLKRSRLESFLGGRVRSYLTDYRGVLFPPGTIFTATEDVCEDTRGDTTFEAKFKVNGKTCKVSDFLEDTVWTPPSNVNRVGGDVSEPVWVEDVANAIEKSKELLVLGGQEPNTSSVSSAYSGSTTSSGIAACFIAFVGALAGLLGAV